MAFQSAILSTESNAAFRSTNATAAVEIPYGFPPTDVAPGLHPAWSDDEQIQTGKVVDVSEAEGQVWRGGHGKKLCLGLKEELLVCSYCTRTENLFPYTMTAQYLPSILLAPSLTSRLYKIVHVKPADWIDGTTTLFQPLDGSSDFICRLGALSDAPGSGSVLRAASSSC